MNDQQLELHFRGAKESDLVVLIDMLADDPLGASRERVSDPVDQRYSDAFHQIKADDNNVLVVVELSGKVVGMLQLTFIPYLTHTGSWRCLIEGVRIHAGFRGQGLGKRVFLWAIEQARERGCEMVQLTSNKQRPDAIRFYESLGFVASHEGFKLVLSNPHKP